MAIFIATIAAAQAMGAVPRTLVHKPFNLFTNLGVTSQMNDETIPEDKRADMGVCADPYGFLNRLGELDHTTGVTTQTGLAEQFNLSEGVVRGAVKGLAKAIPLDRLKADNRLTAQGVELVTRYIQRGDTTAEAWVHGLMQAMKAPEYKQIKGEGSTADDIDLGFLDRKIQDEKSQSTDLALTSKSELAALIRKNQELSSKSTEISQQEKDRLYQVAYNRRIALKVEELKADIKAQQDIDEAMASGDFSLDFQ